MNSFAVISALLTAGAEKMAVTDPHGWTLTLISVAVVFCGLFILFVLYTLMGKFFQRTKADGTIDEATAAAIAMALDAELGTGGTVHDYEAGYITIKRKNNERV